MKSSNCYFILDLFALFLYTHHKYIYAPVYTFIQIANGRPHVVSNLFLNMKPVYRCPRKKMTDYYKDV